MKPIFLSSGIPRWGCSELPGHLCDLALLQHDAWLADTEVRYHVQYSKGLWLLTMLYIAVDNPLKFICRRIDAYPSETKALTYAKILQRGIRKDARGTLKADRHAFRICTN